MTDNDRQNLIFGHRAHMTSEERQQLIKTLRSFNHSLCNYAADEIEWLVERCEKLRTQVLLWRNRAVPQENGND